jgi:hypothetical protein
MLAKRTGALVNRAKLNRPPQHVIVAAGTTLPGISHDTRISRLYRQWLKLCVLCPKSEILDLADAVPTNEKMIITVRQKFREGAAETDPQKIRVLVNSCERSLFMFRELAGDAAMRRFPESRPRLQLRKLTLTQALKMNTMQVAKEYWQAYFKRHW